MIMKYTLLLNMIVCVFATSHAQSNSYSLAQDTTVWVVSGFYNSSNQETVDEAGKFILNHGQSINWIQDSGEIKYDFDVMNSEGDWLNSSIDGRLIFTVERNSRTGKIIFERTNGEVSIQMEFMRDNKNTMPFVFNVLRVEKK